MYKRLKKIQSRFSVKKVAKLSTNHQLVLVVFILHLQKPPGFNNGAGPGDHTELNGRPCWAKVFEIPLQTARSPWSENARKAERTLRRSGGCSQAAVASSGALTVTNNRKKLTPFFKQDVKVSSVHSSL